MLYIPIPTMVRYTTELSYAKDQMIIFKRNENETVIRGLQSILKSMSQIQWDVIR